MLVSSRRFAESLLRPWHGIADRGVASLDDRVVPPVWFRSKLPEIVCLFSLSQLPCLGSLLLQSAGHGVYRV